MSRKSPEASAPHKAFPREYVSFHAMLQRTRNPNNHGWKHYGGRSTERGGPVVVCERWRKSFVAFLEDMGPRPEGTTLDRIDGRKGYSKANTRWADKKTQARNRENVEHIQLPSGSITRSEVATMLGLNPGTVTARRNRGYGKRQAIAAERHTRLHMAAKYNEFALSENTVKSLAEQAGMNYTTVLLRIKKKVPLDEALKPGRRNASELSRRAKEAGLSHHIVRYRMKQGQTLDEAVNPVRRETLTSAARKLGMTRAALSHRIKSGMSREEAMSAPRMRKAA